MPEFLERKKSPLLSGPCAIDYTGNGHPRQLVSNYCTGARNPDFADVGEQFGLATGPVGGLSDFWSAETLEPDEFFIGVLNLTGEVPEAPVMNIAQATRAKSSSVRRASHRYTALLNQEVSQLSIICDFYQ